LAIYRLSKLGLIEDYLIDENREVFIVRLRKKEVKTYLDELFQLFDEFLLPEKAAEEKSEFIKQDKPDPLKILMGHLNFFYNYILKYRLNSIETLYTILSQIPENKASGNDINQGIKELTDRYFHAKYANSSFSLIPGVKNIMGKQQDFGIINGYLQNLGSIKENWLQLKKSLEIIKNLKPDNYIPYLLDAYAQIIYGEQKDELLDKAFDQIARGFITMRKARDYNRESYQTEIQNFLDILYKNRPDLKESYEPIVWLRMHYLWLKDFNTKTS
jgi:hypothetical protein